MHLTIDGSPVVHVMIVGFSLVHLMTDAFPVVHLMTGGFPVVHLMIDGYPVVDFTIDGFPVVHPMIDGFADGGSADPAGACVEVAFVVVGGCTTGGLTPRLRRSTVSMSSCVLRRRSSGIVQLAV